MKHDLSSLFTWIGGRKILQYTFQK